MYRIGGWFNPLNAELNPICHLLALLGDHHIFHFSGLRVKFVRRLFMCVCVWSEFVTTNWTETCSLIFNIYYQYLLCYWLNKFTVSTISLCVISCCMLPLLQYPYLCITEVKFIGCNQTTEICVSYKRTPWIRICRLEFGLNYGLDCRGILVRF